MRAMTLWAAVLVLAFGLASTACRSAKESGGTTPTGDQTPEGKLPDAARPTSYRLNLTIVPEHDTFSGTAVIGIELGKPSAFVGRVRAGRTDAGVSASSWSTAPYSCD